MASAPDILIEVVPFFKHSYLNMSMPVETRNNIMDFYIRNTFLSEKIDSKVFSIHRISILSNLSFRNNEHVEEKPIATNNPSGVIY